MKRLANVLPQTLLIADSDAELCNLYRQCLKKRGYEVITSSGGLDCLRKLRMVTPTVLVLDLGLPWGGGDGVLAWLRNEYPAHEFPVILTVRAGCPPSVATIVEPPVVDYLCKPFGPADLLVKVRSAVAENTPGEPSHGHHACPELFIG